MTFIWPIMLVCLVLIPLLVVVYIRMQQRRRRVTAQYGSLSLLQQAGSTRLGLRRHVPALFFMLALAILIVALARPQTVVSLPRLEGTVILAFDVSGSMSGDDIKPTRMEAAKTAAEAFVDRQPPSVQIGVVSFSDAGFTTLPPTNDQGAVLGAINRLMVQRGTSVAHGIDAALRAIDLVNHPILTLRDNAQNKTPTPTPEPVAPGSHTSAVIILLTDGENNQSPDPMELAKTAADRGIRIYTVGVGSAEGAILHIDGLTVRSRLDEETLKNIAQVTGGAYYNADNEKDLHAIYDNLNPQLIIKPTNTEVTSLFAGAGILILLIGGTLSMLWLGRVP